MTDQSRTNSKAGFRSCTPSYVVCSRELVYEMPCDNNPNTSGSTYACTSDATAIVAKSSDREIVQTTTAAAFRLPNTSAITRALAGIPCAPSAARNLSLVDRATCPADSIRACGLYRALNSRFWGSNAAISESLCRVTSVAGFLIALFPIEIAGLRVNLPPI